MQRAVFAAAALFMLTALELTAARAAEWLVDRSVAARVERNDNYFLAPLNEQSVTTYSVSPSLTFATETEISSLGGTAAFTAGHADGRDAPEDLYGNVSLRSRFRTERTDWLLDGRAVRDPTFASELRETGVLIRRVTRDLYSLQPGVRRRLTERLTATGDGIFQQARYEETGANGLANFTSTTLQGGLSYALQERTSIATNIGWTRFETDPFTNNARSHFWLNSVEHRFSERLRGTAALGVGRVRTEVQSTFNCVAPIATAGGATQLALLPNNYCFALGIPLTESRPQSTETVTTTLFGTSLDWQYSPLGAVSGGARQDVNPSGIGSVVKTFTIFGAASHGFTERMRGSAEVRYSDAHVLGAAGAAADSKVLSIGATIAHQFTRELSVELGARHTRIEFDNAVANASSTTVFCAGRYEWPRLTMAR